MAKFGKKYMQSVELVDKSKLYDVDEKVSREAHKIMKYRQQATQMDSKK